MRHYHHLSTAEREKLLVEISAGKSLRKIAAELWRSPSTISRELGRNRNSRGEYSSSTAQWKYEQRRKQPGRKLLQKQAALYELVRRLFLDLQWSPEQISNRLKHENYPYSISYTTIYRAIYSGLFDEGRPKKRKSVIMKLRRRGKKRKPKGWKETRGGIANMEPSISRRPEAAMSREETGHWEGDTVKGSRNSGSVLTLVDRKSRYLLAQKLETGSPQEAMEATCKLMAALGEEKRRTLTFDRGQEFRYVDEIRRGAGIDLYFAHPRSPWERPTNENTNGLLREYMPKRTDFHSFSQEDVALFAGKLNCRPRKCLGWKTPYEVFFHYMLHFT